MKRGTTKKEQNREGPCQLKDWAGLFKSEIAPLIRAPLLFNK